jgi:hypothetical protein
MHRISVDRVRLIIANWTLANMGALVILYRPTGAQPLNPPSSAPLQYFVGERWTIDIQCSDESGAALTACNALFRIETSEAIIFDLPAVTNGSGLATFDIADSVEPMDPSLYFYSVMAWTSDGSPLAQAYGTFNLQQLSAFPFVEPPPSGSGE